MSQELCVKIEYNPDGHYAYYEDGTVKVTVNGCVKYKGKIVNGKKEGIWYVYDDQSLYLIGIEEYKEGEKVSMKEYYFSERLGKTKDEWIDENNDETFKGRQIRCCGTFKNGKPHGTWKIFDDSEGFPLSAIGEFVDGKPHGKWIMKVNEFLIGFPIVHYEFDFNKKRLLYKTVNYVNGVVDGQYTLTMHEGSYDEDDKGKILIASGNKKEKEEDYGIPKFHFNIEENTKFEGKVTLYYDNGRKYREVEEGNRPYCKEYYDTKKEQLKCEGYLFTENNISSNRVFKKTSFWKFYDEKGKITNERFYYLLDFNAYIGGSKRNKELQDAIEDLKDEYGSMFDSSSVEVYLENDELYFTEQCEEKLKPFESIIKDHLKEYNSNRYKRNFENFSIYADAGFR